MLAPHDIFRTHYQVSYLADAQPECVIYRVFDQRDSSALLLAELPQPDDTALRQTGTLADAVAALHVPTAALLPVREHFAEGLTYYMLLDDPGGQDLGRAMSVPDVTSTEMLSGVLDQVVRLLDVFAVLHERTPQPILVGDLHTADIWLSEVGTLALAPYAILRPVGGGDTPYRAPELEPADAQPTPASDHYLIGAVAYHLLTGWAPPTASRRLHGIDLTKPRTLQPAIAPLLERWLLRTLDIDPAVRYTDIADMRRALVLAELLPATPVYAFAPPPEIAPAQLEPRRLSSAPSDAPPAAEKPAHAAVVEVPPATEETSDAPPATEAEEAPPAEPEPAPAAPAAHPVLSTGCIYSAVAVLVLALLAMVGVTLYFIVGPGSALL